MIKKLFILLQILALIAPVGIFFMYIIMDEGDQFTYEHYWVTAMSFIPFLFVLLLKSLFLGLSKK
ncbi:hypothetical protein C8R30_10838 [Nitrosomonas nitrosa]|uniref:Uncharacterized protein n=1 Tax=Nitrosomonas nitrosa TaxID=52442 RepID=A0A1I4R1X1_9PROT|nr:MULTISPECIES: hypothetical protein [Nitrosomonas]PTR00150.1 hypothetical protein C8R30_10838 [Nitrosomonas nitrosa]CAE6509261.1 conserved hypothetical protein [Nitrosomonas nitrosa]SFM46269.1 hypothetical protein SAMN05421880_11736 [Nitrosomonas nitrosa]HNP51573.1 hypothetical protein [Nitrosomonas nitrosa]